MNKQTTFVGIMGIITLTVLMFIVYKETEAKPVPAKAGMTITPMNEDNEGRPLFIVEVNGKVYDYMYAEEIGVSLLRDSIITDEMIHFCDHKECLENQ